VTEHRFITRSARRSLLAFAAVASSSSLASLFAAAHSAEKATFTGAQIYTEMCVRCHGPKGEGVAEKHDEPLYGDRSLAALTRIIQRTMPEDSDTKCTPEEARLVAEYIHSEFYSPEARARANPPRIDFARLTVPQYLNSVADLYASFSWKPKISDERGFRAEYYNSRGFNRDRRAIERIDPGIRFDFGESSPGTDEFRLGLDEFAIKWSGVLLVEETGDYEIRVKSQNGVRLFLNNDSKALIDAWVSSGPDIREHKETIRLLGGRAYPIRVDYFKFKEKSASIRVEWKPPHKAWEPIPLRHIAPSRAPEVLVVNTQFPADDGSAGYERGTTVSKQWDQATTHAAIEVAAKVIEQLDRLSGSKSEADNRREKLQKFCEQFVERAFRRPLFDEERALYIESQFKSAKEVESAVKRVVILTLKSPRFLYPELPSHLEADHLTATRLAISLWDSLPDTDLLSAAAKGELKSGEQVSQQVARMLQDDRAKAKVNAFFHHWLEMEEAEDLSKDPNEFPDFTDHIIADLRTSLELFIHDIVWSERSDYRDLLTANYVFMNKRLAGFYGGKLPENRGETPRELDGGDGEKLESENIAVQDHDDETFYKVEFDKSQRAGVLTHPYLLSTFAYHKSSSPIHRGVFLTRNIIGRALKPPPAAIQFMDGRFDPNLTMREKVTELTSPTACMGCHTIINPLGFSLEHFDAVGRFRTEDNRKPVDASSDFPTVDGETIRINGARDVANYAVTSPESHRGFVRQLFQHMIKQPVQAYGPDRLELLRASFEKSDFNIQKLVAEIVTVAVTQPTENSTEKNQVAARK
jgi:mono/diheme cytochrome c family protein